MRTDERTGMGGIELLNGTLVVEREPNRLDELAIAFSHVLDRFSIDHVYISGYVSILAGRARSTEDVDVLIERIDEGTADVTRRDARRGGILGPGDATRVDVRDARSRG